jgi:hypothetical protein
MELETGTAMKTSASSAESARIGPKPWRRKIAFSVRVAPLGLGCALLLYVAALEIDRDFGFFNQLRSGSKPMPIAGVEHALGAVRTSMVELPGDGDARAIAHSATTTRMIWIEIQQLTSVVRKLETRYADIVRRYEANLTTQQKNAAYMRSELDRLRHHHDVAPTQVGTLEVERAFTVWPKMIERPERHLSPKDGESEPNVGEQLGVAYAASSTFAAKTASPRSALDQIPEAATQQRPHKMRVAWISNTGLSSELSARFTGLQIARRLDNTRRAALRSKRERAFTINVETRLLGETSENKLLQLDRALNLRLVTTSSEAIDERSSRIRFFPDGSSTGGRIQIQHGKEGATVNVDSSTGIVTVRVNGD